jgi:hypothetical protein
MVTLAASLHELYCEQMNDIRGFSSSVKSKRVPLRPWRARKNRFHEEQAYEFVFYAFYSVQYAITSPSALTVADRDAALKAFVRSFKVISMV